MWETHLSKQWEVTRVIKPNGEKAMAMCVCSWRPRPSSHPLLTTGMLVLSRDSIFRQSRTTASLLRLENPPFSLC